MASTVKWAGTLGDRRAELDCQTVANRILEELDEELVSLDNDPRGFESLILKLSCKRGIFRFGSAADISDLFPISAQWMLDLNTDTKRRTGVLKRESEAFFRQLEQAVKREERRRQDVALAGARERDRYKIELNKVRLETQQQAAELRQALEAEKAKSDRTQQQAQEDAERNRLAQEQLQLSNERDRRRAHVIRLANNAAAHIENLAQTGTLVVDQQNFDEVIESFMGKSTTGAPECTICGSLGSRPSLVRRAEQSGPRGERARENIRQSCVQQDLGSAIRRIGGRSRWFPAGGARRPRQSSRSDR